MEPPSRDRTYAIVFLVLAAAGVGYVCYRVLTPFLGAVAWAIVLAVAFQGPWRYLERTMPRRPRLAAILLTLAIAVIVLLPAALFAAVLTSQAIDVAGRVAAKLSDLHVRSFSDLVALPAVADVLTGVQEKLGIAPQDFQKMATGFVTKASAIAASLSGRLVLGVFDGAFTFVMVIFLLYFFFKDGKAMARALFDLLPTDEAGRTQVADSLQSMLGTIFRGSLLCALAQGLAGGIGWWIAGLPSPALAGAAMAVLSLLPVGGTAIAWLPGSIYLWAAGHRGAAVFLLVWGFVVASFLADNVLRPLLIGSSEELSTLVVFLGVFGGLAAFGLLGIFIGPVALVLATALLGVLRREAAGRAPDQHGRAAV
jgi:predicted PurR-regulated permease PerM